MNIKWLDFSYYQTNLLLSEEDGQQFFVAQPIKSDFHPAVKKAFVEMGFEANALIPNSLIAKATASISKRLKEAKYSKIISIEKDAILVSNILNKNIDNSEAKDEDNIGKTLSLTKITKIEALNEQTVVDNAGNRSLENVLSNTIPGNDSSAGIGVGGEGGSGVNDHGDRDTHDGRGDRSRGNGVSEDAIHIEKSERRVSNTSRVISDLKVTDQKIIVQNKTFGGYIINDDLHQQFEIAINERPDLLIITNDRIKLPNGGEFAIVDNGSAKMIGDNKSGWASTLSQSSITQTLKEFIKQVSLEKSGVIEENKEAEISINNKTKLDSELKSDLSRDQISDIDPDLNLDPPLSRFDEFKADIHRLVNQFYAEIAYLDDLSKNEEWVDNFVNTITSFDPERKSIGRYPSRLLGRYLINQRDDQGNYRFLSENAILLLDELAPLVSQLKNQSIESKGIENTGTENQETIISLPLNPSDIDSDSLESSLESSVGGVPTNTLSQNATLPVNTNDFSIDQALGEGTYGQKIANNLTAIRLVKQLEAENRQPSESEKVALTKFTGWGALKNVFSADPKQKQERDAKAELESLLDNNEMYWARNGVLAQHFTGNDVVMGMYDVLEHMGFRGGNIIEPTLGVGHFIGLMPDHLRAKSQWYGTEIDPIAGKIAQYLYPSAHIFAGQGYQDTEFQYNKYDLAIGNPPFGDERITDVNEKRTQIDRFKIHNYITAKSAMHLKENGVLAFVITHRFLDSNDDEARAFLSSNDYDLLTAIRLPNNAFLKNAGTSVTTDIVFFQKRSPNQAPNKNNWLVNKGVYINEEGEKIPMNQFFVDNPHLMLGKPTLNGTMYGHSKSLDSKDSEGGQQRKEFTLEPTSDIDIRTQIQTIIANHLQPVANVIKSTSVVRETISINRTDVPVGGFILNDDDSILLRDEDVNDNPQFIPLTPSTPWTEKSELGEKRYMRILGMLKMRRLGYELIKAETHDQHNIEELRSQLNQMYDQFVDQFGFINDSANSSLMSGDIKIEFGLEKNFRSAISSAKAAKRGIEKSESYAEKADILSHRVFYPVTNVMYAKNATDGYAVSLSEKGRMDLKFIQEITGLSEGEVITELSQNNPPIIFKDPVTLEWIDGDIYLSGNVKRKYKEALSSGSDYEINAKALKDILPKDININDIFIDMGQTWIPSSIYVEFLEELGVKSPVVNIIHELGSVSVVSQKGFELTSLSDDLSNKDYTIVEIFNQIANKRSLIAYDGSGDERTVNPARTRELNHIAKKMRLLFNDWLISSESRSEKIETIYNETQNTTIKRQFNGKYLKRIGSTPLITLRDTQSNAAWRMIQSQAALLDHVVGAGKTFTLITGIMERKRLGISSKPMLVVPNHLVTQWAIDFIQLYPGADILAATEKDFEKNNRRKLFARIATGKFDAIIIGHSSSKFIPISRENEIQLLTEETESLENALSDASDKNDKRGVRTLTNRLAKRREKIRSIRKIKTDNVITFEDMGIDYLAVDESHEFKNLEYSSLMPHVAGMGNPHGSQKAFDLYFKIKLLQRNGGGIAFATGTPVSNSLVEMYAIMRYLNPQGLAERNILAFDAWAKNYALIEPRIEYTATQQLKERTIMCSFNNIPEMMQLYESFSDIVTMNDLKEIYSEQIRRINEATQQNLRTEFPVPKINHGGCVLMTAKPNESQVAYMDYLTERSLKIESDIKQKKHDPKVDNLLWVYSDAKKAALDMRIIDPSVKDAPDNKVNRCADEIMLRYNRWHNDKGTQLVFCDLSTPSNLAIKNSNELIKKIYDGLKIEKDSYDYEFTQSIESYQDKWDYLKSIIISKMEDPSLDDRHRDSYESLILAVEGDIGAFITADSGFSVYDALKKALIDRGIPEKEIQFIHNYKKSADKKDLFDQVNAGNVRVLVGSTAKMGAGTNAQERVVALHMLDSSMHNRPSDIEQRVGRVERQGNKLYERDPDNFALDIIAYSTEKTFDVIAWQTLARKAEMLEGFRKGARKIEENSNDSASYMEFMAETTGNPIFKEKVQLELQINEMEAEERRYKSKLSSANQILIKSEEKIASFDYEMKQALRGKDSMINSESIFYNRQIYQRDYQLVIGKINKEYQEELAAFNQSVEQYTLDKTKWAESDKSTRGPMPKKPKHPDDCTLFSPRTQAASSEARFIKAIHDDITNNSIYGSIQYRVGDVNFTIRPEMDFHKKYVYKITDNLGILKPSWIGDSYGIYALPRAILNHLSIDVFEKEIKSIENSRAKFLNELSSAKRIVDSKTSFDAENLNAAKQRYEEVANLVNQLEEVERERRLTSDNIYILKDEKRFGHLHRDSDNCLSNQGMSH